MVTEFEEDRDLWEEERRARRHGITIIAGIDEAGRGPLAGPVVAAAVAFDHVCLIPGLDDSKKLSSQQRDRLYPEIRHHALAIGIGLSSVEEIDRLNILEATRLAMVRAVKQLHPSPELLLVDAVELSAANIPFRSFVRGDSRIACIAAASIIAKVVRDRLMNVYHRRYSHYHFDQNKGYGTRHHRDLIVSHGICPIHRRTFRGVKEFVKDDTSCGIQPE